MNHRIDSPSAKEHIARIRNEVPEEDIYNELAEEASELAQAALKVNRVKSMTNPTPTDRERAMANLVEEYTDVFNIAERILNLRPNETVADFKLQRWCWRLDRAREKKQAD